MIDFGQEPRMMLQSREQTALVVSQCCRNAGNDYVALAIVQPLGNLKEDQERALLTYEPPPVPPQAGADEEQPRWDYAIEHFRLEPLDDVLETGPGRHQVAFLSRIISFWGDCSDLLAHRAGRMTPAGRRLLRLNLALFWSRAEETDAVELEELGLPPGLLP